MLLSKAKRSRSTPQLVSTRAQLYSNTATIRFLGTMSNAEIRIRTPYPAAPCGSVTKIALKDLEKYDPRDAGALRAGFSLILGLAGCRTWKYVPNFPRESRLAAWAPSIRQLPTKTAPRAEKEQGFSLFSRQRRNFSGLPAIRGISFVNRDLSIRWGVFKSDRLLA